MDKFTKDKIKQINKLNRRMRYEIHHMKHLLFSKHPRSINGIFKLAHKLVKITTTIKMLSVQIEIIKQTPRPKYQSGCFNGIIGERGPEMVMGGCNSNFINPIQSLSIDPKTNKVVKINKIGIVGHGVNGFAQHLTYIAASKR